MMAEKARLFWDVTMLAAILQAKDPGTVKALGRKISSFIQSEWEQQRFEIVVRGNHARFVQHPALNDYLQSTAERILVEASPYDPIWRIGLDEQDEAVHNPNRWRSLNRLGFAIMAVRARWCNDQPASPCAMIAIDTLSIPPPVPPKPPVPDGCWECGCEMCVWDYYHEAERHYEAAVAAWQQQAAR